MFEPHLHRVPRPRPDRRGRWPRPPSSLRAARRPLIVRGGGVRYSGAAPTLLEFAEAHGIPIAETAAGRTAHARPAPAATPARWAPSARRRPTRWRPRPTSCWRSAPGCRTSPPRPGASSTRRCGWSRSTPPGSTPSSTRRTAVVGDARETLAELDALPGRVARRPGVDRVGRGRTGSAGTRTSTGCAPAARRTASLTYAQVVGGSTTPAGRTTTCSARPAESPASSTAAGAPGRPRTVPPWTSSTASPAWVTRSRARGAPRSRARRTHPDGLVTALLGDGSYLMLNSELFSAAFAGHPFVAVVCDNGGYAVIHRLQTNQGGAGFNNLLADCAGPGAKPGGVRVDFAAHAASLGCAVVDVPAGADVDDLRRGLPPGARARPRRGAAGGGGLPHAPGGVDGVRRVVGGRSAGDAVRTRRPRGREAGSAALDGRPDERHRSAWVSWAPGGWARSTPRRWPAGCPARIWSRWPTPRPAPHRVSSTGSAPAAPTSMPPSCSPTRTSTRWSSPLRQPRTPIWWWLPPRAGKAVFCEKPMALTLADADRAIAAAERAGVPLQVGFNRRFATDFAARTTRSRPGRSGRRTCCARSPVTPG